MIRTAGEEDIPGIVKLMNECFRTYRSWGLNEEKFREWLRSDPGVSLDGTYLHIEGDKIAAMVQVVEREIKVEREFFRTAGIANVCTGPEFRGRGLARELLEHALVDSLERGYELSALLAGYGEIAHSLYRKLGFRDVYFTRYGIMVQDELKKLPEAEGVRYATEEDAEGMLKLYERRIRELDGVVKRNLDYFIEKLIRRTFWHTFFYSEEKGALVFDDGKIRGYALVMRGTLPGQGIVREILFDDSETAYSLLSASASVLRAKSLKIFAPEDELELLGVETFKEPEVYMFKPLRGELPPMEKPYIFYSDRW
ncbi:GNAT family N-acetyltransferase [Thermococcus gammatolerans]|uniref:Acetyltransferase, GNAT family n=1 Tax=Thermococcus gammatolerans (strain DSM 15229 / JCM 11827 / EJ3) TaxID=593117 RepID=C5A3T3_THEGJ|nr:GNAT family N-acetyltransferase [Thermococcus gammatolerans]ACS32895.1 Acetyltransferase, GNAT family [Thermococcus gammatolerans EJ3]